MSRFTLDGHRALEAKASSTQTDDPSKFAVIQAEAEMLLGVSALPETLTAGQDATAALAVCLQINFQLERGIGPLIRRAEGSKVQEKSTSYREDLIRDPRAVALVESVREAVGLAGTGAYAGAVRSLRGGRPLAGTG